MTIAELLEMVTETEEQTGFRPYKVKMPHLDWEGLRAEASGLTTLKDPEKFARIALELAGIKCSIADDFFTYREEDQDRVIIRWYATPDSPGVDFGHYRKEDSCS